MFSRFRYRGSLCRALLLASFFSAGCIEFSAPESERVDSRTILAEARISTEAVIMQLEDSLQLSVHAISMEGSTIELQDSSSILWLSSSSQTVSVDSTGMLRAHKVSVNAVNITATVTVGNVTKSHRIPVYVSADKFQVTHLKVVSLDSAKIGKYAPRDNRVRIDLYLDDSLVVSGVRVPLQYPSQYVVSWVSSDGEYNVRNNLNYTGASYFRVKASVYGVDLLDSLQYIGLYPFKAQQANLRFKSELIYIPPALPYFLVDSSEIINDNALVGQNTKVVQPCAAIEFVGMTTGVSAINRPIDVVFDDSLNVGGCDLLRVSDYVDVIGGNILNWIPDAAKIARRSSTVGTINWYIRDAITKEPLGISGSYISRTPRE